MRCIDCIHNGVCELKKSHYCLGRPMDVLDDVETTCSHFSDEMYWVRLPVKVGDTVYAVSDAFGAVLSYNVECLHVYYDGSPLGNGYIYEANSHPLEQGELLDSIDFEPSDIGKIVFLTEEEALQTFERRE